MQLKTKVLYLRGSTRLATDLIIRCPVGIMVVFLEVTMILSVF